MQLPSTLLFFTYPFLRRIFGKVMKIIGSRFRLSLGGKRHQPDPTTENSEHSAILERRFKRKALLIGVRQVRDIDTGETAPGTPQTPLATRRGKKKPKTRTRKVDNSRALKGPHRDVQAMKKLLVGTFLRFTLVRAINHGLISDVYHYDPQDITTLIDDDDPNQTQPTRENIVSCTFLRDAHLLIDS